jgi:hypothetical protein
MDAQDFILAGTNAAVRRETLVLALAKAGAISPAAALPFEQLGVVADDAWDDLVLAGRIREGQPGYFYAFNAPALASPRERRIKMFVFSLLIVAIPIVLILLNRRR